MASRKKKPTTAADWRNPAFEGAIAASPGDDGPYLVYADWFETRGEARRATALRVLGGQSDASADGVDAGRLALTASSWFEPGVRGWDFFPAPRSVADVRAARRRELLPAFLHAWGNSSPFEVDASLCEALEESEEVDDELALPRGATIEDVAFEHVVVNQNGTTGISGAMLLTACDVTTAFDLLAAHLTGQEPEDLCGQPRADAIDDATDWVAMSRAVAYAMLWRSLTDNEGHGFARAGREVELLNVLDELGPMRAAVATQTEFSWLLMQFERGWLAFYITF